jgi:hypothetical protein
VLYINVIPELRIEKQESKPTHFIRIKILDELKLTSFTISGGKIKGHMLMEKWKTS